MVKTFSMRMTPSTPPISKEMASPKIKVFKWPSQQDPDLNPMGVSSLRCRLFRMLKLLTRARSPLSLSFLSFFLHIALLHNFLETDKGNPVVRVLLDLTSASTWLTIKSWSLGWKIVVCRVQLWNGSHPDGSPKKTNPVGQHIHCTSSRPSFSQNVCN